LQELNTRLLEKAYLEQDCAEEVSNMDMRMHAETKSFNIPSMMTMVSSAPPET